MVRQRAWGARCPGAHPAQILAVLSFGYILEPILTQVYMSNMLKGAEKVLATLRCAARCARPAVGGAGHHHAAAQQRGDHTALPPRLPAQDGAVPDAADAAHHLF